MLRLECFSVVVATDGAAERRLPMSFNTRADAEETVLLMPRSARGCAVSGGRSGLPPASCPCVPSPFPVPFSNCPILPIRSYGR